MVLGTYLFPVNSISNKKRAMRPGARNPCKLNTRRYAALLTQLNEYLIAFTRFEFKQKFGDMELNQILLHSMTSGWDKQDFIQGIDFEMETIKKEITCLNVWILRSLFIKV